MLAWLLAVALVELAPLEAAWVEVGLPWTAMEWAAKDLGSAWLLGQRSPSQEVPIRSRPLPKTAVELELT